MKMEGGKQEEERIVNEVKEDAEIAHCSVKQYTLVLYNTAHCSAAQCSRVE